jgi:phenylalanyl-tRNA synthetase beta chain
MAGLEVDSAEPVATSFNQVVIGEVLTVEAHPDAKKLHICQVNIGEEAEPLIIVCGASNVQPKLRVPTALVGARIGKIKIKTAKLRGVQSYGMLCSAEELGLAESSEGLMALPEDAPIGEDVRHYLQLEDISIDIELTPNRGDCLGVEGIAREVGVLTRTEITKLDCSPVAAIISDTFPIEINVPNACPRYVGRVIKNINADAPTPLWMQERLRRSGLRSISAIVDVTNYVLLELGQPMHAFDLASLSGGIQVRMARAGESLTLLDEQTVQLDEQTLLIADNQQPLAMAGVMGGLASAVTLTTQDIFLESAFFTPEAISGTARRYGLHTDSSHRFERGVDPQLQKRAMERATALLLEIVGGKSGPIIELAEKLTAAPTIELRASRIERLLGQKFDAAEINEILTRLGMTVMPNRELSWQVQPPSFRFDISLEADLIEELARVHGYNHLPSLKPQSRLMMYPQPFVTLNDLQAVLVQRDYQEAITYSFVDPKLQAKLDPNADLIHLANPIASDMAVMRTTLWAGLLPALSYNQKRQQARVRLFETGLRFNKEQGLQEKMIAGVISGTRWSEQWGVTKQPVDFYDVKADVEALLSLSSGNFFRAGTHPALHPGQTAEIYRGEEWIGVVGALHPSLLKTLELTNPVYLFECLLAPLCETPLPQFQELSKYPSIRRDIALLVPNQVDWVQLFDCIKQSGTDMLVDCQLFDVYQGKGIKSGKKSLAISLTFQAFSRSLTDSEIETVVGQILNSLENNLEAKLRT